MITTAAGIGPWRYGCWWGWLQVSVADADDPLAITDADLVARIAARLGLPLGTVKTRAFHAMRALRAALARQGFDPAG
jgi:hypothetical protein